MTDDAIARIVSSIQELRSSILAAIVPEDAQTHFRLAQKEMLLGIRDVLQHAIDKCDHQEAGHPSTDKADSQTIEITE